MASRKRPRRISLRELEKLERMIERAREKGFRAPRGWASPKEVPVYKVKRRPRLITVEDLVQVSREGGVRAAVNTARAVYFHPDEWAQELYDYDEADDLDVHGLYDSYFYPEKAS